MATEATLKTKSPSAKSTIWRSLLRAKLAGETDALTNSKAPAHVVIMASLLHRMFIERMAFVLITAILLCVTGYAFYTNHKLAAQLENPDVILVPSNVTDILRIRANTVPDRVVYDFAESIVSDLANTNYEDVDERYQDLTRYMHPELKTRFQREAREHIELWQLRKIDQIFSYEKPANYSRTQEVIHGTKKPVYTVEIWGSVRKYVEGRATQPYRERITLKFTTSAVTSDKPWVFELVDIKRETTQDIEDARLRLSKKGENR